MEKIRDSNTSGHELRPRKNRAQREHKRHFFTQRVMIEWTGSLTSATADAAVNISKSKSDKHLQEENMTGCKHLTEGG